MDRGPDWETLLLTMSVGCFHTFMSESPGCVRELVTHNQTHLIDREVLPLASATCLIPLPVFHACLPRHFRMPVIPSTCYAVIHIELRMEVLNCVSVSSSAAVVIM